MGRKAPQAPAPMTALAVSAAPSPMPSPIPTRRQPLLLSGGGGNGRRKAKCAEIAGGTAAGCAAVCCCCPCGLVNLLVLTMVRLPAGLCRKAIRKRRAARMAKKRANAAAASANESDFSCGGSGRSTLLSREEGDVAVVAGGGREVVWPNRSPAEEVSEMDVVMWDRFRRTGFWRSPSQAERD